MSVSGLSSGAAGGGVVDWWTSQCLVRVLGVSPEVRIVGSIPLWVVLVSLRVIPTQRCCALMPLCSKGLASAAVCFSLVVDLLCRVCSFVK